MTLSAALEYMDLNKSSYCYEGRPRSEDKRVFPLDSELETALKEMAGYELTLGYDKATDYLRAKHDKIWNRKKVYRHMKILRLLQPRHIKCLWRKNKRLATFCPLQSNVRWEADLTWVATRMGMMYLVVIEDVYDREALSGHMNIRAGAEEAIECLKEALRKRFGREQALGLRLTVRVDRGCQFTAEAFAEFAHLAGIELEFCGVQTPNDKPYIESFIGCYKLEEVYRNDYQAFFEAYEGWNNYMTWYNTARPHGSLANLSPAAFREQKKVSAKTG